MSKPVGMQHGPRSMASTARASRLSSYSIRSERLPTSYPWSPAKMSAPEIRPVGVQCPPAVRRTITEYRDRLKKVVRNGRSKLCVFRISGFPCGVVVPCYGIAVRRRVRCPEAAHIQRLLSAGHRCSDDGSESRFRPFVPSAYANGANFQPHLIATILASASACLARSLAHDLLERRKGDRSVRSSFFTGENPSCSRSGRPRVFALGFGVDLTARHRHEILRCLDDERRGRRSLLVTGDAPIAARLAILTSMGANSAG